MGLKAVTQTLVYYEEGDLLGKLFAYLSLSPIFILVALFALLLTRREAINFFLFIGLVFGEFISEFLKETLKQPRPPYVGSFFFFFIVISFFISNGIEREKKIKS